MTERVFVLGAGRAGLGLARAFRMSGVDVVGVHGRHARSGAEPITAGPLPTSLGEASVVLVTVRDTQLDDALAELARAELPSELVVLHASGASDPPALASLRALGHAAGTFHPLVPLADPSAAPGMLRGSWIGIDGDAGALRVAGALAAALGARTLEIPPGEKARYHAAAVVASNFPAVLLSVGERLLVESGVQPDVAALALRPLFLAAAENLRTRSGAEALTGPIVRGDVDTVRRHLAALASDAEADTIFRALSRAAVPLARAAGTDPRALNKIETLLAE